MTPLRSVTAQLARPTPSGAKLGQPRCPIRAFARSAAIPRITVGPTDWGADLCKTKMQFRGLMEICADRSESEVAFSIR
jgi:hypothetical protein